MTPIIISDIDGTICDITHRLHNIQFNESKDYTAEYFEKNWEKFYKDCIHDKPIINTIRLLNLLKEHADIIFFTGRSDLVWVETHAWIYEHTQLPNIQIHMRKAGDHRQDHIIKREMFHNLTIEDQKRVTCIFEDRQQVVDMWRKLGLTCYQVAPGDF